MRRKNAPRREAAEAERQRQAAARQEAEVERQRREREAAAETERLKRERAAQEQARREAEVRARRKAAAERSRRLAEQRQAQEWERLGLVMVRVDSGSFTMGCQSKRDGVCSVNEKPAHQVQVGSFEIGKYEVTQMLWELVMGKNPSRFSGCAECPVERVSWDDVQAFLAKLNARTGRRYRLPSEAEWEYAARGGRQSQGYRYAGSNEQSSVAWYKTDDSGRKTYPVGQKRANELGLHDMSGNVQEWIQDCWNASYDGALSNGHASEGGDCGRRGGAWRFLELQPESPACRLPHREVCWRPLQPRGFPPCPNARPLSPYISAFHATIHHGLAHLSARPCLACRSLGRYRDGHGLAGQRAAGAGVDAWRHCHAAARRNLSHSEHAERLAPDSTRRGPPRLDCRSSAKRNKSMFMSPYSTFHVNTFTCPCAPVECAAASRPLARAPSGICRQHSCQRGLQR